MHTVAEAIERYRREVLPRKGQGTQQSYDGHLRWWRRRLGSTPLANLQSSEILVHRDRLARHKSPATVNRYLASLSAVLSAAMLDWEWLEASPMARVRALPEPRGRVRYLSDAERPRLLEAVQASHEPALAAHQAHAERSLVARSTRGTPHALTQPRPRCDEDHRLCVIAITSPFDGVATNGMTQG